MRSEEPHIQSPPASRDEAVQQYAAMVRAVAMRMCTRMPANIDVDDLISAGMIGLIEAFDRFDHSRNHEFRKFAIVRVKGAMLDEVRLNDPLSRTFRRRANEVGQITHALEQSLGRTPTEHEIATAAGLDPDGFQAIRQYLQPVLTVSTDALSDTGRELSNWLYEGAPVDPLTSLEGKRLREFLETQIALLKERLALVLRFHFFDGMTLREIGRVLGVSESRTSQILSEALEAFSKRLRIALRRSGGDDEAL